MARFFSLLFLLCFSAWVVLAQLPTDFRTEQVYLNPDCHVYLPGDTIELEGQVACQATGRFLPYSQYLYVELFGVGDSLLLRQKVACKDRGYFNTRLPLSHDLSAGVYYLRGYTRFMKNFSPRSFAVQPLLVGAHFPDREDEVYEAHCQIAFQGGTLAAGSPQTVAVRLSDDCTFPLSVPLFLLDESGDTVSRVHTSASGLALLHFIPREGTDYFLSGSVGSFPFRFSLPPSSSAPKVQGSVNGRRVSYHLQHVTGEAGKYRLYTFDRRNGLTELSDPKSDGIILLDRDPEVVSLFLTDVFGEVLSECAVMGRWGHPVGLEAPDTLLVGDSLRYFLPSLPEGSRVMSRVLPANDLLAVHGVGALGCLSDYDSPFPFPAGPYAGNGDALADDLQVWLCSAQFKRFRLKEAVEQDTALYVHLPEQVMAFGGWIENMNKRPQKGGTLVAYHTGNDLVYDAEVGRDGRFVMAVDDYADGESFFLQTLTPKGKPEFATIHPDEDTYPGFVNTRPFRLPRPRHVESEVCVDMASELDYVVGNDRVRNYVFPEVTVKARLRAEDPPKETNQFYRINFADREKIEERNFQTLYDILRDMPGITVCKEEKEDGTSGNYQGSEWVIFSNRGPSVLSSRNSDSNSQNNNLPILVDRMLFHKDQYEFLLSMPAFEIESVEFLRPWQTIAYLHGAINGAILIKTRSYKERPDLPSKGSMYTPTGLSPFSGQAVVPRSWTAFHSGRYRLVVDVFTDTSVQSYEHVFEVIQQGE